MKDVAFEWYNRQPIGQFRDWPSLRDAFLAHFRPIGFKDRLRDQLLNSRMIPGETVDAYYGRVADMIRKWPNNDVPNPFVLSITVNGLYPSELKMFVKEARPQTVVESSERAKVWEECHYDQYLNMGQTMIPSSGAVQAPQWTTMVGNPARLMAPANNTGGQFPTALKVAPLQAITPTPPTANCSPYQYPSQPTSNNQLQSFPSGSNEALLINLTKQMEAFTQNVITDQEKKWKQTNFRQNVWCTKCKGQGHMASECPWPANMKVQCQNRGKGHPTEECWHLVRQHQYNNQVMVPNTQWDVNQVQGGPRYGWSGQRPNNRIRNPQDYRNNTGNGGYAQNTWQGQSDYNQVNQANNSKPMDKPGSFTKPTWNVRSRYIPVETPSFSNRMDWRKPVRCFRCKQSGHYPSECNNDPARDDYGPICANCKQTGHLTSGCNAPFNYNNKDPRIRNRNPVAEHNRQTQESPENFVEVVQALQTRPSIKTGRPRTAAETSISTSTSTSIYRSSTAGKNTSTGCTK